MLDAGGSQRVADLMRETAAAELLPRFRNLSKEDVRQKRPGDIVTVADEAAEQRLASGWRRFCPACRWWARRPSRRIRAFST